MSDKQKFFDFADKHDITVEYTRGGISGSPWYAQSLPFHCMCDAPQGKVFSATGLHVDGSIQGLEGTTKL